MSSQTPAIVQHADHPEWGRGLILPQQYGRADRFDIAFESGGTRTILKSFAEKLTPVAMPADEAALLGERLASRRTTGTARSKARPKAGLAAAFTSFDAQLASFLAAFPDGFAGEKFEREVRGVAGAKRRKTDTGAAIVEAGETLSAKAFAEHDEATLFEAAARLVKSTAFVHPLEGANLLGAMPEADRSAFVAALRDLLHGSGDAGDRFDRFVSTIKLEDGKGAAKRPTWPMTTVFAALVHPTEHVCVKPTVFQKQAALLKVVLDYQPLPTAAVYSRFLTMVRKTEAALVGAGQQPRDLVDVASFIALGQGAKSTKATKS